MASSQTGPFYPLIFVRGYAGDQAAVEDAAADPYMGFNVGSSKLRQLWTGKCERYFFESPLVRLMKDFEYRDVYDAGEVMGNEGKLRPRAIYVFRYYDRTSLDLGDGERLTIPQAAAELGALIRTIRERTAGGGTESKALRVNLVAHSMGGLVCRCLLQNQSLKHPADGDALTAERKAVDKVFTYATPHNGIDLNLLGNVPGFWTRNDADNFNRDEMSEYLQVPKGASGRVNSLNGKFDPDRIFCLIGTNHRDYDTGRGIVRKVVGAMSDGLVRIENAATCGPVKDGSKQVMRNSPRAFVHRSHSGHYGILNSEEGFQNLIRFLFGDARIDCHLEVMELKLPHHVQKKKDAGKEIRASYHFEAVLRVRGKPWDLHRRTTAEDCAVFRSYDEMFPKSKSQKPRHPFLFSTFLSIGERVNPKRASLGFSLDLRVLVPEYKIGRTLWRDEHYEGGFLFRDKINFEAVPPSGKDAWRLRFGFDSSTPNQTSAEAAGEVNAGKMVFRVPVEQATVPGLKAMLVISARSWNVDQ